MKIIKYQFATDVDYGTPDNPDIQQILTSASVPYSEKNLAFAKAASYNGEVDVLDDPDIQEPEPTEIERLRADLDYISVMTGVAL